ncbi:MAG: PQQ-binding-like beta-propeller repeat protein [Planctomycetota bacterium]
MRTRNESRRARAAAGVGAACLLAAGVLAAGCASTGVVSPGAQSDSLRVEADDLRTLGYARGWQGYPIVTRGRDVEHALVADDVVLVLEGGSTLSCLDVEDRGRLRWSRQLDTATTPFFGIAREGNLVYANSSAELFVVDLLTGDLVSRQALSRQVSTGPVRVNGQLIFGCGDGQILSWLPSGGFDGIPLWDNKIDGPVRSQPVLLDAGFVGIVSETGNVMFLDPQTGSRVREAGGGARFNALFGGPGAQPDGGDRYLVVASEDQSLWAFDAGRSQHLWRVPTEAPLSRRPIVHQGIVYADLGETGFHALDLRTGDVLWQAEDVSGELVAVRDDLLIVFDAEAEAIAQVDLFTGDVFARIDVPGVVRIDAEGVVDRPIYMVTDRGLVAQFTPDA